MASTPESSSGVGSGWSVRSDAVVLLALSAVVQAMLTEPDTLDDAVATLAPQADLEVTLLLRGVRQIKEQLDEAAAHGR